MGQGTYAVWDPVTCTLRTTRLETSWGTATPRDDHQEPEAEEEVSWHAGGTASTHKSAARHADTHTLKAPLLAGDDDYDDHDGEHTSWHAGPKAPRPSGPIEPDPLAVKETAKERVYAAFKKRYALANTHSNKSPKGATAKTNSNNNAQKEAPTEALRNSRAAVQSPLPSPRYVQQAMMPSPRPDMMPSPRKHPEEEPCCCGFSAKFCGGVWCGICTATIITLGTAAALPGVSLYAAYSTVTSTTCHVGSSIGAGWNSSVGPFFVAAGHSIENCGVSTYSYLVTSFSQL